MGSEVMPSETKKFSVLSQIDGKRFRFTIRSGQVTQLKISKIKRHLSKATGLSVEDQKITFKGRVLEDHETGATIGIEKDSTLFLALANKKSPRPQPEATSTAAGRLPATLSEPAPVGQRTISGRRRSPVPMSTTSGPPPQPQMARAPSTDSRMPRTSSQDQLRASLQARLASPFVSALAGGRPVMTPTVGRARAQVRSRERPATGFASQSSKIVGGRIRVGAGGVQTPMGQGQAAGESALAQTAPPARMMPTVNERSSPVGGRPLAASAAARGVGLAERENERAAEQARRELEQQQQQQQQQDRERRVILKASNDEREALMRENRRLRQLFDSSGGAGSVAGARSPSIERPDALRAATTAGAGAVPGKEEFAAGADGGAGDARGGDVADAYMKLEEQHEVALESQQAEHRAAAQFARNLEKKMRQMQAQIEEERRGFADQVSQVKLDYEEREAQLVQHYEMQEQEYAAQNLEDKQEADKQTQDLRAQISSKTSEQLALAKKQAEWEMQKKKILQNWSEETEILTVIWKEDKEKWQKEKEDILADKLREHNEKLEEEAMLFKYEQDNQELRSDLDYLNTKFDEMETETRKLELRATAADRALAELKESLVVVAGGDEPLSELLVNVTAEKKAAEAEVEQLAVSVDSFERRLKEETLQRRQLHNMVEDLKGRIRVICRMRPYLLREAPNEDDAVSVLDDQAVRVTAATGVDREFEFYRVLTEDATQQAAFREVKPLIQCATDGTNVCILAYGQTGSGKTYTMIGPPDVDMGAKRGVLPMAIGELFARIEAMPRQMRVTVRCQMIELYRNKLRDLLEAVTGGDAGGSDRKGSAPAKLQIRMNGAEPFVQGAVWASVGSGGELERLLRRGLELRQVAKTALNESSSRSHTLFYIRLEMANRETGASTRSLMTFADLAGSERVGRSGSTGDRFKEAQAINKSLSSLGDIISALCRQDPHIPYRNSKLGQLLVTSLGGNSKCVMFANICPPVQGAHISESLSTLEFASRVRMVRNVAVRTIRVQQQQIDETATVTPIEQRGQAMVIGKNRSRRRKEEENHSTDIKT